MEREAWLRILIEQAGRRPLWQLQDMYKLAFQAALGSEHAVPDPVAARRWLEDEIAGLGEGSEDPPLEGISADGRLARVNLRPYLATGGSREAVLGAFLRTAAEWRGEREMLRRYLEWAVELAEAGELGFPVADLRAYFQCMAQAGFPALHHSAGYRDAYRPAYRVVMRTYLPPTPP
jgi:hypothetical protein